MQLPTSALLALLPFFLQVSSQASGTGKTTRYWDCCKPSCAWPGKTTLASGSSQVQTCDVKDSPLSDPTGNAASGCSGGTSYMCSDQSPWAVSNDLAYGYAAVNIASGSESSWCCACYELTFTSTALAGKKMIVQATNTGGDLGSNQFDLAIPGGGVGIFNGCTTEFGAPSSGWGAQYGGVSDSSACDAFPTALKPGCDFRFDWFEGADNPEVSFKQVECPAALTAKTGCKRADDGSMPAADASGSAVTSSSVVASTSSASASASASASSASSILLVASSAISSAVSSSATSSGAGVQTAVVSTPSSSATLASSSSISSIASAPTTSAGAGGDDDTCDAE